MLLMVGAEWGARHGAAGPRIMRIPGVRRDGDSPTRSGAHGLDRGWPAKGLQHGAVALGPRHQAVEVLGARAGGGDLGAQADRVDAGRHLAVDPERPAQVEVALDDDFDLARVE